MKKSLEIDSLEFARRGEERLGAFELSELKRIADLLASADGQLSWAVEGRLVKRSGRSTDAMLRLRLSTRLSLRCGRCLAGVTVPVHADRQYLLVATEDEAARRDDPEADFDVLVGSRRFDLVQWIEDELVLELPPVSFHDDCEAPAHRSLELDAASQTPLDERRRPFAALAGLKAKSSE